MTKPFSERLFEFAFNAEFVTTNSAVLIGTPDIPSQDAEKWLGYDVAFELQNSKGDPQSLALQHKVMRFVDGPGSHNNHHFRKAAGPRYFAFPIDVDQFNIIQSLSSLKLPYLQMYYCAPLFFSRGDLNKHYGAKSVVGNSIYIDISTAVELDPSDSHTIVVNELGTQAWVFSEYPQVVRVLKASELVLNVQDRAAVPVEQRHWDVSLIQEMYQALYQAVDEGWRNARRRQSHRDLSRRLEGSAPAPRGPFAWPNLPPIEVKFTEFSDGVQATTELFAKYLNMSWLAGQNHESD